MHLAADLANPSHGAFGGFGRERGGDTGGGRGGGLEGQMGCRCGPAEGGRGEGQGRVGGHGGRNGHGDGGWGQERAAHEQGPWTRGREAGEAAARPAGRVLAERSGARCGAGAGAGAERDAGVGAKKRGGRGQWVWRDGRRRVGWPHLHPGLELHAQVLDGGDGWCWWWRREAGGSIAGQAHGLAAARRGDTAGRQATGGQEAGCPRVRQGMRPWLACSTPSQRQPQTQTRRQAHAPARWAQRGGSRAEQRRLDVPCTWRTPTRGPLGAHTAAPCRREWEPCGPSAPLLRLHAHRRRG